MNVWGGERLGGERLTIPVYSRDIAQHPISLQKCRQVECILLIIISVSVSRQTGTTVRRACQKSFLLTMCISPGNEDPGLGSRGEWRKAGTRVPDDQQLK